MKRLSVLVLSTLLGLGGFLGLCSGEAHGCCQKPQPGLVFENASSTPLPACCVKLVVPNQHFVALTGDDSPTPLPMASHAGDKSFPLALSAETTQRWQDHAFVKNEQKRYLVLRVLLN